jgi:hypothetical protein
MSDQLMVSGTGLNRPIISFQSLHPPMQPNNQRGGLLGYRPPGNLSETIKKARAKQSGNGFIGGLFNTLKPTPEKEEKFKKLLYVKKFSDTIGLTGK